MSAPLSTSRFQWLQVPSWAVSAAVHFALLLVLTCITISKHLPELRNIVRASQSDPSETIEELSPDPVINLPEEEATADSPEITSVDSFTAESLPAPEISNVVASLDYSTPEITLADWAKDHAPKPSLLDQADHGIGSGGYGLRETGSRMLKTGPTNAQEAAIASALKWLAAHQSADGGWNFDHRIGPCQGRCGDAGDLTECRTGATALALLPFLGVGQTHREGVYKKQVEAGLRFLISQMQVKQQGNLRCGDLAQKGGSMYAHGLAAIALCEAYGMTQDRALLEPAQLSLNQIVYAQDPVGGGWRYQPRTPGDTSVVGWQLMALKSGHMSYLNVPKETIAGAIKFLDSVQTESGARYGYTAPGGAAGTTAVGLLCRMYLGWNKDHPGIERGIEFLCRTGPSKSNLYYDYYATQAMLHYAGPQWDQWNSEMTGWLIDSQDKNGHQAGSWLVSGDHGTAHGGRLYCTSLATLTLEVRIRISPLYKTQATEDDFPL